MAGQGEQVVQQGAAIPLPDIWRLLRYFVGVSGLESLRLFYAEAVVYMEPRLWQPLLIKDVNDEFRPRFDIRHMDDRRGSGDDLLTRPTWRSFHASFFDKGGESWTGPGKNGTPSS